MIKGVASGVWRLNCLVMVYFYPTSQEISSKQKFRFSLLVWLSML